MARAVRPVGCSKAFDDFLSAAVGPDARGTDVSVLSMLARLGVDPWREASDLTAMPEATAQQRLEALLERFKDVPTTVLDRGRIALGLLAFLPRRTNGARASAKGAAGQSALPAFKTLLYWSIASILFFGWVTMLIQGN